MQIGTVIEYQEQFEHLSNKVDGLLEKFLLSYFISGLKPHIQHEVASFQPTTLTKAMALAKIQEQKVLLKSNPPKLFSPQPPLLPTPNTYPTKPAHTPTTTMPFSTKFSTNNPNAHPKTTVQKLSHSQIQTKRDKGLCFYCDDKYVPGHKCRASAHILIIPDSDEIMEDEMLTGGSLNKLDDIPPLLDTP